MAGKVFCLECFHKLLIIIDLVGILSYVTKHRLFAKARTRGYKKKFMLNSAEHEILNSHKYKNIKKFSFFRLR